LDEKIGYEESPFIGVSNKSIISNINLGGSFIESRVIHASLLKIEVRESNRQ
jgi:hypothetical protein